jgi:hypothetical protein
MIKHQSPGWSVLFALALVFFSAVADAQQPEHATKPAASGEAPVPAFERAIDILKASSSRLAAARTMSFTAVISYENPSLPGPPLVYTTRSEVTLQRPDKLRVITPGDGPASEFYYNGKTVMAYAPAENLVAVAEAPPTIDAALQEAYYYAAMYFPFTDVIVADPYKHIAEGLTIGFYIGQSRLVGGTTTDMVAYETHGTFVQIWIGAEDKLPRLARAVYLADPSQLRHQIEYSNWRLNDAVPADVFQSPGAAGAKRIPFARPDAPFPTESKPSGRNEPSKTK